MPQNAGSIQGDVMLKRLLACVAISFSLSACALTVDEVDLVYKAREAAVVGGANAVRVDVSTNDARTSKRDRISVKKNGYGMEMAAIVPRQDVPKLVAEAVETELKSRGFQISKGSVAVQIDINKFYSDFKTGFFSGEAVGEVMLNVQVANTAEKPLFTKTYIGEYTVENVMLMSGPNATKAVEGAFDAALAKVMSDQAL